MKRFVLKFTEVQLMSMIELMETVEASLGGADIDTIDGAGDSDVENKRYIRNLDKMLSNNGLERKK